MADYSEEQEHEQGGSSHIFADYSEEQEDEQGGSSHIFADYPQYLANANRTEPPAPPSPPVSEWLGGVSDFSEEDSQNGCMNSGYFSNLSYHGDSDDLGSVSGAGSGKLSYQTPSEADSDRSHIYPLRDRGNLGKNGIYILPFYTQLPPDVSNHLEIIRTTKDLPGLSDEEFSHYRSLLAAFQAGNDWYTARHDFDRIIFKDLFESEDGDSGILNPLLSMPMTDHLVPHIVGSKCRVKTPRPHRLFCYNRGFPHGAFTENQLLAQVHLHPTDPFFSWATIWGFGFPFLVTELKLCVNATSETLYIGTNECAAAAACSLKLIQQLNSLLPAGVQRVDRMFYSIVVDSNIAQLYAAWVGDQGSEHDEYYLQLVETFVLTDRQQVDNLRKHFANILHWGKVRRLEQIRAALDFIYQDKGLAARDLTHELNKYMVDYQRDLED